MRAAIQARRGPIALSCPDFGQGTGGWGGGTRRALPPIGRRVAPTGPAIPSAFSVGGVVSVYLTSKGEHVKPIESLLLRIVDPSGNRVKGRLPGAQDFKRELNRQVSARQRKERARLLGDGGVHRRMRREAAESCGSDARAGLIERRLSPRAKYKGKRYTASLRKSGQVAYGGHVYGSPSAAGKAVVGRAVNGWHFWRFRRDGEWVRLRELRK